MADTVTTNVIVDSPSVIVVHLTGISDGTGETGVKKVDIATLTNYFGVKPSGLRIEQVRWALQGFTYVKLGWDRTAAAITAMTLAGNGYDDYRGMVSKASGVGGVQDTIKLGGLPDPSAGNADGKGSILLTSVGPVSGATYDITLWLRKEPNQA